MACAYATHVHGIPCILLASGSTKRQAWDDPDVGREVLIYTNRSVTLIGRIVESGKPYLPYGMMLSVNLPVIGGDTLCTAADNQSYVLTRVTYPHTDKIDIEFCGRQTLPVEYEVSGPKNKETCFISVSPVDVTDLTTINDELR